MKRRKEKGEEEKGKGKRGREEENNIFWKKLSSYITGGKKFEKFGRVRKTVYNFRNTLQPRRADQSAPLEKLLEGEKVLIYYDRNFRNFVLTAARYSSINTKQRA